MSRARRLPPAAALAAGLALLIGGCATSASAPAPPAPSTIPEAIEIALPTIDPPAPTVEPVTRLLFTGDIIPARCTYERLRALGDYTAAFHALRDVLTGADLTIGTLDSTLSQSAEPIGCVETFNLAGPAAFTDALASAGFDVISHAANHVKDCGAVECGDRALLDTIANLRGAGIRTAGSGANLREARAPAVVERNGIWFAFLSYDDIAPYYHAGEGVTGAAPLDFETVAEDIANARKFAQVVVVLPHWGVEYTSVPAERQREFARAAAAAGADLVVGNHPHWVQAHETVGRTFVAYALGNFVFDQDWSLETQQGAMLEVTFTGGRLTGTRYLPVRIHDGYQPRLAVPPESDAILQRIEAASAALTQE